MESGKSNHNRLFLLLLCILILGGCAGTTASPPYFKDIFETSRQKGGEQGGAQPADEKPVFRILSGQRLPAQKKSELNEISAKLVDSDDANPKAAEIKKPLARIMTVPNPLKREIVKAEAEKSVKAKLPLPPEEPPKPLELSAQAASGDVQIVVENMPLYDFANLAFGEILRINYTIAEDVASSREKITLNMSRKMTGKDFFPFAVDLLRKNNLDIREENGMIYVRRKDQQAAQYTGGPSTDIYVGSIPPGVSPQKRITLIIATNYVPASQILQVVRQLQLLNSDIKTETLPGTQSLALSGTVGTLSRVVGIFDQLDRTAFAERDFNLVYFDYINITDFDKKMKEVMPALGVPMGKNTADVGLLTIPFEKINALLVISARKEWFDMLISWKDKLDAPESMGDEMQMFVYRPKNRPAEELVEVLKAVSSSTAAGGGLPATGGPPSSAVGGAVVQQKQVAPPAQTQQASGGVSAIPGRGFSAIHDKGRNAVIVSASPANYKLIRNILTQLDTPPKQVLIEATILEVTLTGNLQYGVEWLLNNRIHKGGDTWSGTLGTMGGLALGASGFTYSIAGLDLAAKLNAFAKDSDINIVSTPHIATLDGKEASISVGTEVPIVTSEATAADIATSGSGGSGSTSTSSLLRSIQYRNTGVILHVKPTINSEGALTIDIGQELSEAQNNSVSNIDSPIILNRSIRTTLSVKSGDTVLLGGLISTNKSKGEQKVPILGDIPLLGWLFKTASKGETKTELIVQITPYILDGAEQLDDITRKFKETVFLK